MAKVISYEKFIALKEAGITEQEAVQLELPLQLHAAGKGLDEILALRARKGSNKGW